ncbi:N-acyl-D-amino-acid deacylase [Candidatus Entotheonella serta]|nr:N-acyl-D-amino-acid deacylase [Candidatus Entotheonella serta]
MDDLLIRGPQIIDGSGAPGFSGDVAIQDGRISAVTTEPGRQAKRVIDGSGLVVAPGFIDIHTHSDFTLPLNPKAEGKIRQGVTTEVVGNCGFSVAPALPGKAELLRDYLAASAPWLDFRETSFADYMDAFPATSVNTIMQAGHHTLRLMAMGTDDRAPNDIELQHMQAMLEEALHAGAIGLSSGLFTTPGGYASSEEMVALGHVLRRHGGAYSSHVRDEANRVFDAVREAIAVGETCGIHVQIAHLKLSGTDNWGGASELLGEIEAARERGVQIDCDQYPYTAATNPLRNLLPTWVQAGGMAAMLARLAEPETRQRLRDDIEAQGLNNFGRIASWDDVRIAISPHQPEYAGQTMGAIARERNCDPLDAVCDYLLEDQGHTRILITSMSEDDVQAILRSPTILVGSDGTSLAPYGVTGQGKPHPRFYGTFARILGHYVRDVGLLSLEQAVYKMTGGSAKALGLVQRGLIREGYWADLTLFDPQTIDAMSTYEELHQYAKGIQTVIVNGELVIDDSEHTGDLPGCVLRRGTKGVDAV